MKRLAIIVVLFSVLLASFGCAIPKPPGGGGVEGTTPSSAGVAYLNIYCLSAASWDADPEVDGFEVEIRPYDINDAALHAEGIVSAKLWSRKSFMEETKGELLQEWHDIHISEDDYGFIGATLRLEYKGHQPEEGDWGILEVTLTTPDQESFTARDTLVDLS